MHELKRYFQFVKYRFTAVSLCAVRHRSCLMQTLTRFALKKVFISVCYDKEFGRRQPPEGTPAAPDETGAAGVNLGSFTH